jgi:hypothetical protein
VPAEPVIAAVPEDPVVRVARAALAVPEDLVVPAARAALVVPEDLVVPAVRAVLVVPENPAAVALETDPVAAELELNRVEGPELVQVVALVREIDPAVEPERVIDPVVVVRAQLIVPVAAELGHDPAVARELATAQPRGHLAVLAKTKSVTAAHHHDLVRVLVAEDLAAAAETTREPAAAEAARAWAAAE